MFAGWLQLGRHAISFSTNALHVVNLPSQQRNLSDECWRNDFVHQIANRQLQMTPGDGVHTGVEFPARNNP